MNKKLIKIKKKYRFTLISILVLAFLYVGSSFALRNTYSYKIDNFGYKLNNYNERYTKTGYKQSYIKITSKEKRDALYDDLFNTFYYSDDSGSIRQYMNNSVDFNLNGNSYNIRLYSQRTYYILNTLANDGGYRIDYGLFHAYFSDEQFGNKKTYLNPHFNCDSFIFISDTFADKLIAEYNLPNASEEEKQKSYLKLITEEDFAVLKIRIDEKYDVKLSINNIIYTNKRSAPRCLDFNEDFGTMLFNNKIKDYFNPAFEIDLKSYPFYTTSVLNKLKDLNYNIESYNFSFNTFDYKQNYYHERIELSDEFIAINNYKNNVLFLVIYLIICTFSILYFSFIFVYTDLILKNKLLILIFLFSILLIYSVCGVFVYTFPYMSILYILMIILGFIFSGKEIYAWFNQRFFVSKNLARRQYKEINI